MKLSQICILLVSGHIFFSSCNSTEKYKEDLLSNDTYTINKACYKLGKARDTSAIKPLLTKALDPRISHHIRFHGTSVNYNRLKALQKISGINVVRTDRFGADTTATLYYLNWAIKQGFIKDTSEVDIYYYK